MTFIIFPDGRVQKLPTRHRDKERDLKESDLPSAPSTDDRLKPPPSDRERAGTASLPSAPTSTM